MESLTQAAVEAVSAAAAYASVKSEHQNTAQLCLAQGILFRPLVVETTGAWDKEAARILRLVAAAAAAREGADPAGLQAVMLQEMSVTVRSFRARAALRRRAEQHVSGSTDAVRAAVVVLAEPDG
jgi:hypothetical protein